MITAEQWHTACTLAALREQADAETRELAETGRVLRDAVEPAEVTE